MVPLRASLLALGLVAAGCVAETSVVADRFSVEACREALLVTAPSREGCVRVELRSSGDRIACVVSHGDGSEQPVSGQWVRIERPHRRRATIAVRLLESHGCIGEACYETVLTRAASAPCSCAPHALGAGLGLVRVGGAPVPLYMQEQELLISGTGVFEVEVCTEDGDAWPGCARGCDDETLPAISSVRFDGVEVCQCMPPCDDDEDCPLPLGGSTLPRCRDGACVLDCASGLCGPAATCHRALDGEPVCLRPSSAPGPDGGPDTL